LTPFKLKFTIIAAAQLAGLKAKQPPKHKKVLKCLGLIEKDPKYPGLNSHRYEDYDEVHGEKIWESYAENKTPGAYRVFWHHGPKEGEITVVAITPHP
jgi:hypothetical protein